MKRFLSAACVAFSVGAWPAAWSYDAELARSYEQFFSGVTGAGAGSALQFLSPEAFIGDLKRGRDYVAIDIRTPAEAALFTLSLPGSLRIPANQIFSPDKLALIPTDKPVVIVCKSGARAAAIGTSLRHVGFDNVHILKGGFQALADYYGPGEAYAEPAPEQ
jgi:rhodanese-related sulfurtransferase